MKKNIKAVSIIALVLLAIAAAAPTTINYMTTYESVADMVANKDPRSIIKSAHCLGYYTPGDGGGGNFSAVSGITSTNFGAKIKAGLGGGSYSFVRTDQPPFSTKQFGAKADGSTDDYARVFGTYGLFATQSDGVVSEGTHIIGTSYTVLPQRGMRFTKGAIIKPSSGVTLTIGADILGPHSQHFDCTDGSIVFNNLSPVVDVNVNWFGAEGDTSVSKTNQNRNAFQWAVNAVSNKRQWVFIPSGTFMVGGGSIELTGGKRIRGVNRDTTAVYYYAATNHDALFYIENSSGNIDTITFEKFGAHNGVRNTGAGDITDIDTSTDVLSLIHPTTLTTGSAVNLWTASAAPGGLTAGATVYVRVISNGQIPTVSLHPTANDANNNTAKINITSYGTGPHSLIPGTAVPVQRRACFLKDANPGGIGDTPEITAKDMQFLYWNSDVFKMSGTPYFRMEQCRFLSIANSIEWGGDQTGPSVCVKNTYYSSGAWIKNNRFGGYCDRAIDITKIGQCSIEGNFFETLGRTTTTGKGSQIVLGGAASTVNYAITASGNYFEGNHNSGTDACLELKDCPGAILNGNMFVGDYGGLSLMKNAIKTSGTTDFIITGGAFVTLTNGGAFVIHGATRRSKIDGVFFSAVSTPTELTTESSLTPYLTGEEYIDLRWRDVSSAHGKIISRKLGGTVGSEQIEISHNGTYGLVESKSGALELKAASGQNLTLTAQAVNWDLDVNDLAIATFSNDNSGSSAGVLISLRSSDSGLSMGAYPSTSGVGFKADKAWIAAGSTAAALQLEAVTAGQYMTFLAGTTSEIFRMDIDKVSARMPVVINEQASDISSANVTSGSNAKDRVAVYMKNDKLVFAYNAAGTVTYLSIPLDGSTTTWTHSTSAP